MSNMFWFWMAAAVIFLIIELATPSLVFFCFTAGAVVAGIFGQFYPDSYAWQTGLFIIVSGALLPLTRGIARKISKESPEISNVDRMINQTAQVTKAIDPDTGGQIQYEGEIWRASADEAIEAGTKVTVISVTGTTAKVNRIEN